jgi:hypothetical protein
MTNLRTPCEAVAQLRSLENLECPRSLGALRYVEICRGTKRRLICPPVYRGLAKLRSCRPLVLAVEDGKMTTTLQIAVVPKRMLTKQEAAQHCGRSVKRFELECPCRPVRFPNGDLRFDIQDLDGWLTSLKAGGDYGVDAIVARLA